MTDESKERALVTLLADAQMHSADEIANHLSLPVAELSELIDGLAQKGLEINSDDHLGLRLARPLELLDEQSIRAALGKDDNASVSELDILWCTDSTNSRLMAKPTPAVGCLRVCLAEFQSAGRGRQQRIWRAPLGGGLCMSVSWALENLTEHVATAGLVAGVAVRNALEQCGVEGLQLKWPNDLVRGNRKLGGLLLEVRGATSKESHAAARLVIGIGLNYFLNATDRAEITGLGGLEPGDIVAACKNGAPDRNALAAAVLTELLAALKTFSLDGFAPFADAWRAADACKDAPVEVTMDSQRLTGVARGIDASGALQLDKDGDITSIVSAQVRLRMT